ncbi:MAG: hypothetical protein AABX77_00575 [Nanoarchaeota archaeon]
MKNYRVISMNRESEIKHNYMRRKTFGHYQRINVNGDVSEEKTKKLLEKIAKGNEEIIRSSGLNKLKVNLEVTTYEFD